MSQAARLASMDARMSRAFLRSGLADSAIYAASIGALGTVPNCTVMIDRDVQVIGELGEVVGSRTVATFNKAELTPAVGGALRIGSETWTIEKKVEVDDESHTQWVLNG